jgi:hypothetical protein
MEAIGSASDMCIQARQSASPQVLRADELLQDLLIKRQRQTLKNAGDGASALTTTPATRRVGAPATGRTINAVLNDPDWHLRILTCPDHRLRLRRSQTDSSFPSRLTINE